jgi:hypothetical protein
VSDQVGRRPRGDHPGDHLGGQLRDPLAQAFDLPAGERRADQFA